MGLFLFVVMIFSSNRKNLPIAFLMLAFSLILFQYVLYWTGYEQIYPYLQLVPQLCYYTTGPLLYLYFLRLYKEEVHFNFAAHFLPAAILLIPNIGLVLTYLGVWEGDIPLLWIAQQPWFIVAHMMVYIILIIVLIRNDLQSDSEYTYIRDRWARTLLSLYALFVLSYISYYVLVRFSFFNDEWDYMISIMMTVSIYTIGYFIMKQPQLFDGEFYGKLFLPNSNSKESLEGVMLNELYLKVQRYMETEKPYIDNELRLVHLADQLGFSTHLLSKVINNKSGKNFNKFVNEYRLREAERLLAETNAASVKSVYFDVGFNSKAAFYAAFKQKHNCTPSEFRNGVSSLNL